MLEPMKPEEALLIFEKLASDKVRVLCVGLFWGWHLSLVGTISISEGRNEISFLPGEGNGSVTLRLDTDDLLIWYSEPKDESFPEDVELPEYARESASLSFAFPLRLPPSALTGPLKAPRREKLLFIELKEKPA